MEPQIESKSMESSEPTQHASKTSLALLHSAHAKASHLETDYDGDGGSPSSGREAVCLALSPVAIHSQCCQTQPQRQAQVHMQIQLPTLGIAADIKHTLTMAISTAIAELRLDLLNLTICMDAAAAADKEQDMAISVLHHVKNQHSAQLVVIQRYVEDLDNRAIILDNIRVQGVPETVSPDQVKDAVKTLFNQILSRSVDTPLELDRVHRALRPRNPSDTPPRDIICGITNYLLKEEIMVKERAKLFCYV